MNLQPLELSNSRLLEVFNKMKKSSVPRNQPSELSLIYEIIEFIPLPIVLEEFIFSPRKYNILIKHDALIRAIEMGYVKIIEKVITSSNNIELLKTAIININNDEILHLLIKGSNLHFSNRSQTQIQELALKNIKDDTIFSDAFADISNIEMILKVFKQIKYKSNYRSLTKLQRRLLPLLYLHISHSELTNEFNRSDKYPSNIRAQLLNTDFMGSKSII